MLGIKIKAGIATRKNGLAQMSLILLRAMFHALACKNFLI
jgi:hypothetical protein